MFLSSINLRRLTAIVILLTIFGSTLSSASAQNRRVRTPKSGTPKVPVRNPAQPPVVTAPTACKGNWSGIIKYEKTRDQTSSQTYKASPPSDQVTKHVGKVAYNYTASVVIDGRPDEPVYMAKAKYDNKEDRWGRSEWTESCHAFNDEHQQFMEDKSISVETAQGEGDVRDFYLNMNYGAGTYSFSVKYPEAKGTWKKEQHSRRGGFCQPKNNEPIDTKNEEPIKIEGHVARVENYPLDPKNPNILRGRKVIDESYEDVTVLTTITWTLNRCPMPLIVTDLKFYDQQFPSENTWAQIADGDNTVDGNLVKIKATVLNLSAEPKYPQVVFTELKEGTTLPGGDIGTVIQPNEEREVELLWDTSGYAWTNDRQRESRREIKVEAGEDQMTKPLLVYPRPVMLASGLTTTSWNNYDKNFYAAHSSIWYSQIAQYNKENGITPNAQALAPQIKQMQEKHNAWHVDIVAHSTGGLVARSYIHNFMPVFNGRPAVTRLIMLGTPNNGTPCAQGVDTIFTRIFYGKPQGAFADLFPRRIAQFNREITNRKGTRFAAIAGGENLMTCQAEDIGDGVVPIASARYNISDWSLSDALTHDDLTNQLDFKRFVLPRLAIGPKGNHAPDSSAAIGKPGNETTASLRPTTAKRSTGFELSHAALRRPIDSTTEVLEPGFTLSRDLKLQPNQTLEIDVPVLTGAREAIVFIAPKGVSVTLLDQTGAIVGTNLTNTPAANLLFRTINVKRPIAAGTWKLRLENREASEATVGIVAFTETNAVAGNLR